MKIIRSNLLSLLLGGIISLGMSDSERFASEQEKLFELRQQGLLSEEIYNQAVVSSAQRRSDELNRISPK